MMKRVRRFLSRRSRAGRSSFGKRMCRVRRWGFRVGGRRPGVGAVVGGGTVVNKFVRSVRGFGRVEDVIVIVREWLSYVLEFESEIPPRLWMKVEM
jgi:hypothetical protein